MIMNMNTMGGMMALGIGLAGIAPAMAGILGAPEFRRAAATESATPPASESTKPPAAAVPKPLAPALDESPETAQPAAADTPLNDTDRKKKVVPKPVVVEPLTPEQATHKAADPKAPTGALIVKPPEDLPAPAAGSPEPPPVSPTK
jgi:hypothetical protein